MSRIYAPFTDEQVDQLHQWQSGMVKALTPENYLIEMPTHPFTCCSHDGCKRSEREDEGVLIPSNEGWICPCGEYKQNWCHDFMIK